MITPTPLDKSRTVRRRNLRTRRLEIWGAFSTDGVWAYVRAEEPGTPWYIRHVATDRVLEHPIGSLIQAQRDTASGWAMRRLDEQTAERAGLEAPVAA